MVKVALNESERAQSAAVEAIQLAQNNTRNTLDLLISVSLENISDQNYANFMYKITLMSNTAPLWLLPALQHVAVDFVLNVFTYFKIIQNQLGYTYRYLWVLQVESETATSELKLSNTTGRLILLEREVGLLRQNSLEVNQLQESAKQTSEQARENAEEAQKVHTHTHPSTFSSTSHLDGSRSRTHAWLSAGV